MPHALLDTPAKVASLIQRLRRLYVVGHSALIMLRQPDLFDIFDSWGFDQYSQLTTPRHDQTQHATPLYDSLLDVQARAAQYANDFERSTIAGMLVDVGDACARNQYFDKTPELEFVRHLRNAAGHGNTFNLLNGEPRRPATFSSFKITADQHGLENVLFDFIGPGDVLDLLSNVEAHLRLIEGRWTP